MDSLKLYELSEILISKNPRFIIAEISTGIQSNFHAPSVVMIYERMPFFQWIVLDIFQFTAIIYIISGTACKVFKHEFRIFKLLRGLQ